MMNLENLDVKKAGIAVAAAFVGLLLVTVVWLSITYGRLVVERADTSKPYSVSRIEKSDTTPVHSHNPEDTNNAHVKTYTGSSVFLKSGTYVVRYNDGEQLHTKYVEVPNFLGAATISFISGASFPEKGEGGARHTERVAAKTLDNLGLGTNKTVMSFDVGPSASPFMFSHSPNDPKGLGVEVIDAPFELSTAGIVNNHLVGFTPGKGRASVEGIANSQPTLYNMATKNTARVTKESYPSPSIIEPGSANHNSYGVAYVRYSDGKQTQKMDVYAGTRLKQRFGDLNDVANISAGNKAVAISKHHIAMGFGEDYTSAAEGNAPETSIVELNPEPSKDYIIKVLTIENKKQTAQINIGKTNSVSGIQVNNSGSHVAVMEYGAQLTVYDTGSGEIVFTQEVSPVSPPRWIDNQRLIFGSSANGLFLLNAKAGSATTLFAADFLNLNSYNVVGNKILFTAYSDYSRENNLSTPDGYIAYLDRKASHTNQLVKKLPTDTGEFTLSTLRNKIYAAPNVPGFTGEGPEFRPVNNASDAFKSSVRDFLEANFDNYKQYELIFGENL